MQYIDTYELTRLGGTVQGHAPIAQLTRLLEGLPQQSNTQVSWTVSGDTDTQGRRFLRVLVDAAPMLECQRCMQPFEWRVQADTRLQVVKSEADLDEGGHDAESDDLIERIVGSARLDILALVEDEVILGLPYVPKHDVCPSLPEPLAQEKQESEPGKPSPFGVLSQLKKN